MNHYLLSTYIDQSFYESASITQIKTIIFIVPVMKTRKHRIFIIGKRVINRLNENNTHLNQDGQEQLVTNAHKQRVNSKRKNLFSQLPQTKEKSQKKLKGNYVYQIKQNMKTESIGGIFKCDLFGSEQGAISKTNQQKLNIIKDSDQGIRNEGKNKNQQNFNQQKAKLEMKPPGQIINDKISNKRHWKIFDNENFRQHRVMSSHLGAPRKNIFFTYESPDIALDKTFTKERRRIFSLDNAPHQVITKKKSSIIQQIRSFIKEQEQLEQSKINQNTTVNKEQSILPLISS